MGWDLSVKYMFTLHKCAKVQLNVFKVKENVELT